MRIAIFGVISLILVSFKAYAQPAPQISRIDVVQYGIYVVDGVEERGHPPGSRLVGSDAYLVEATATVPARPGINFGFLYRVVGEPAGVSVPLHIVTIYPSFITKDGSQEKIITRNDSDIQVPLGEISWTGVRIGEDTKPGIWTIQLWTSDRKLAEQSFSIVEP